MAASPCVVDGLVQFLAYIPGDEPQVRMLQDSLQELHEALEKISVWHAPDGFALDAHRLARQEHPLVVLSHLLLEVLPQRLDVILVVEESHEGLGVVDEAQIEMQGSMSAVSFFPKDAHARLERRW